jgi:hypothetical protein
MTISRAVMQIMGHGSAPTGALAFVERGVGIIRATSLRAIFDRPSFPEGQLPSPGVSVPNKAPGSALIRITGSLYLSFSRARENRGEHRSGRFVGLDVNTSAMFGRMIL